MKYGTAYRALQDPASLAWGRAIRPRVFKSGDVDGTLIVQLDGANKTISLGVR